MEPPGIEPGWRASRLLTRAPAHGPTLCEQERDWLSNQHDGQTQSDSGGTVKAKNDEKRDESAPAGDRLFRQTVKRLLDAPPKPHDEMKKGAAPKRDAPSSGRGAKG